ncbi:MAG: hypothetical protein ABW065_13865 [Solirubrobacterales bacterium]
MSGDGDRARIRGELEQMIAEYRFKPTQELEDQLGLRIAVMPAEERDLVPAVLLEIVASERG